MSGASTCMLVVLVYYVYYVPIRTCMHFLFDRFTVETLAITGNYSHTIMIKNIRCP